MLLTCLPENVVFVRLVHVVVFARSSLFVIKIQFSEKNSKVIMQNKNQEDTTTRIYVVNIVETTRRLENIPKQIQLHI